MGRTSHRGAALIAALVMSGCGGERLYLVEGKVLLDGHPLETGHCVLHPADDREMPANRVPMAKIGPGGVYQIKTADQPGAPAGQYHVVVIAQTDKRPPGVPENPMSVYPLIHAKYMSPKTSPLLIEVGPAKGPFELNVSR